MRSIFLKLFMVVGIASLSACMGQHNQAPSEGANLENERVYGQPGGEPRQLPNKYPEDDGTQADRIMAIQKKLYPETETTADTTVKETSVVTENVTAN